MSRLYIIIGVFLVLAATVILSPVSNLLKSYLIIVDLMALLAVLGLGASRINSQLYLRSTCKGDPEKKMIAITFDDGPDPAHTPEILKILHKYDCKASFFLIGMMAESNEDLVRDMFAAGHSIGNHSYSHSKVFPLYQGSRIAEEIVKTNEILEQITGKRVKYFRPPFGVTNPRISRGLRGLDLKVIGWNNRSLDTRNEDAGTVLKRIGRRLRGGDIILLHDTSDHILDIVELLLQLVKERGLTCVSLDTMFKD